MRASKMGEAGLALYGRAPRGYGSACRRWHDGRAGLVCTSRAAGAILVARADGLCGRSRRVGTARGDRRAIRSRRNGGRRAAGGVGGAVASASVGATGAGVGGCGGRAVTAAGMAGVELGTSCLDSESRDRQQAGAGLQRTLEWRRRR